MKISKYSIVFFGGKKTMDSSRFSKKPSLLSATNNESIGVGIQIEFQEMRYIISSLTKDSVAERAGFLVGDEIVKIDGESVDTLFLEEVEEKLLGLIGSLITITIQRAGEIFEFSLIRGQTNKKPKLSTEKSILPGAGKKTASFSFNPSPVPKNPLQFSDDEPSLFQDKNDLGHFSEKEEQPTSLFKMPVLEEQFESEFQNHPPEEEKKPLTMMERVKIFYETSSFKLPLKSSPAPKKEPEQSPYSPQAPQALEQQFELEFQDTDLTSENSEQKPTTMMERMKIFYETSAFKVTPAKSTPPPPKKAPSPQKTYTLSETLAKNKALKEQEAKKKITSKLQKKKYSNTSTVKYVFFVIVLLLFFYTLRSQFPKNQDAEREAFLQKRRIERQKQEQEREQQEQEQERQDEGEDKEDEEDEDSSSQTKEDNEE